VNKIAPTPGDSFSVSLPAGDAMSHAVVANVGHVRGFIRADILACCPLVLGNQWNSIAQYPNQRWPLSSVNSSRPVHV
jgi:hypothetical protein